MIAEAYGKNLRIQGHIQLQWRFVPKKVIIQIPFEDAILPSKWKYTLYKESDEESKEVRSWNEVSDWTCSKIEEKMRKQEGFKWLNAKSPGDSNWDLWFIRDRQKGLKKRRNTAKINMSMRVLDDNELKRKQSSKPIKFGSNQSLQNFVLMLRQKEGIEPGDKLLLEYRRVPSKIVVDLSCFDVDSNHAEYDELSLYRDITSLDISCKEMMNKVGAYLLKTYHVPQRNGGAYLELDRECIWEDTTTKSLRKAVGKKEKRKRKRRKMKGKTMGNSKRGRAGSRASKVEPANATEESFPFKDPEDRDPKGHSKTLREFVESLRVEEGHELKGTIRLKWNHNIPRDKMLKVKFELMDPLQMHSEENDDENTCSEILHVNRFETHGKLMQKLKNDKGYKEWQSRKTKTDIESLCTLYFNSAAYEGAKASKMVIFEKHQNLQEFFDRLEDKMVATKGLGANKSLLILQYLEGMYFMSKCVNHVIYLVLFVDEHMYVLPGPTDKHVKGSRSSRDETVYFCRNCGTFVERTLKLPDRNGEKQPYLNPHAILYFSHQKGDGQREDHLELCQQCLYFKNLDIDTDDDGSQATNQGLLFLTGIFLNPAVLGAISLPFSHENFVWISIIVMV